MSDDQAYEVPFVEQLRSIPKDYRTCRAIQWSEDGMETGHQLIPVGFMMHRAADEIERLKAAASPSEAEQPEVAGLKLALEHIEATKQVWTDGTHIQPQALIKMIESSLHALLVRSSAPEERK